jgi:DNA invertase Pin-like site-specific DNA recombinase
MIPSPNTRLTWVGSPTRNAREEGTKLGRKALEETDAAKVKAIRAMRHKGTGIRHIARELGVGVGTVMRVTARA